MAYGEKIFSFTLQDVNYYYICQNLVIFTKSIYLRTVLKNKLEINIFSWYCILNGGGIALREYDIAASHSESQGQQLQYRFHNLLSNFSMTKHCCHWISSHQVFLKCVMLNALCCYQLLQANYWLSSDVAAVWVAI